jgi:hypothetical protein
MAEILDVICRYTCAAVFIRIWPLGSISGQCKRPNVKVPSLCSVSAPGLAQRRSPSPRCANPAFVASWSIVQITSAATRQRRSLAGPHLQASLREGELPASLKVQLDRLDQLDDHSVAGSRTRTGERKDQGNNSRAEELSFSHAVDHNAGNPNFILQKANARFICQMLANLFRFQKPQPGGQFFQTSI